MCFCDGTVSEYVFRWVKGWGGGRRVSECACSCVFQRERERETEREPTINIHTFVCKQTHK